MRWLLALHDADFLGADGTYWTWHHPELSLAFLEAFYYDEVAQRHPNRANGTRSHSVNSHLQTYENLWYCWFQFLEGGFDSHGRPGRIVLLVACAKIDSSDPHDDSWALLEQAPLIEQIRTTAASRPVPCPENLELRLQESGDFNPPKETAVPSSTTSSETDSEQPSFFSSAAARRQKFGLVCPKSASPESPVELSLTHPQPRDLVRPAYRPFGAANWWTMWFLLLVLTVLIGSVAINGAWHEQPVIPSNAVLNSGQVEKSPTIREMEPSGKVPSEDLQRASRENQSSRQTPGSSTVSEVRSIEQHGSGIDWRIASICFVSGFILGVIVSRVLSLGRRIQLSQK